MDPWLSIVLLGIAIFGFAWLSPKRSRTEVPEGGSDPAYDRLLDDLETENRELVEAVAKFKEEQDETVKRLVGQIVELERQMKAVAEQAAASQAVPAAVFAAAAAAMAQPSPPQAHVQAASDAAPVSPKEVNVPAAAAQPADTVHAPASIRVRYSELLTLHGKGRSVEQIAKTVGMNKGEVQLILQLARREDQQRA